MSDQNAGMLFTIRFTCYCVSLQSEHNEKSWYLLDFLDEPAAVNQVDDIVVAGGAEMFFGQIFHNAGVAEHLRAMRAHFGSGVLVGAQGTGELVPNIR